MPSRTSLAVVSTLLHLNPVSAWPFFTGYGFGSSPAGNNETFFHDAIQDSNNGTEVAFQLGPDSNSAAFVLDVNTTSVPIPGADVGRQDPVAVYTQYTLRWDNDGEDLNSTVAQFEGLSEGRSPRLCIFVPEGPFRAKYTNAGSVAESGPDGSCSQHLGPDCVKAIQSSKFGGFPDGECPSFTYPDLCKDSIPGVFASASLLHNESRSSPAGFFYHSQVAEQGSQALADAVTAENQMLHMVIFTTQDSFQPVCARIEDVHVDKDSPATAGAGRMTWSTIGAAAVALAVGAAGFAAL